MTALVVVLPPGIALVIPPEGATRLQAVDAVAWLVFHVLIAGAGAMLFSRWRLFGEPGTGWLAAALVATGMSGTPFAILDMADVANYSGGTGDLTGALLALPLLVLLVCASRDIRLPDPFHPLVLGVVTGVVVIGGRLLYGWLREEPFASLTQPQGAVMCAVLALTFLVLCVVLRRRLNPAGPSTVQFVAMFSAIMTTFLLGPMGTTGETFRSWPSVVVMVFMSWWLTLSAAEALLEPLAQQARRIERITTTPEPSPLRSHQQEELFHELRSTVADISTASEILLGNDHRLSDVSRQRLSSGLATEVARLQRLVSAPSDPRPHPVSLDQVIAPLVVTQRAAGHDIRWEPSGHHVHSSQDDVSEILHILLHNALRHAPGTTITISVHPRGHAMEIRVSDDGPGIPADVRGSLFERGARSAGSPGSGLGLYLARRLATKHGGQLELRHNDGTRGASFVVALPQIEGEDS
ncbi:hypothetical protein ASG90_02425 [Nocardioides sp. Soil797]|nr:hypothetical protein ASG90_02425 [Nocardioides sp. Soil797]